MWKGFWPNLTTFFIFCSQSTFTHFFCRRMDFVGNGCEWMKWHGMRPGSSLGMCMEHVEEVLAQFDNILHGLAAVDVYGLISATERILSEIAANG